MLFYKSIFHHKILPLINLNSFALSTAYPYINTPWHILLPNIRRRSLHAQYLSLAALSQALFHHGTLTLALGLFFKGVHSYALLNTIEHKLLFHSLMFPLGEPSPLSPQLAGTESPALSLANNHPVSGLRWERLPRVGVGGTYLNNQEASSHASLESQPEVTLYIVIVTSWCNALYRYSHILR